ncbi:MAG TPA: coenzyme F420 hydrogenase [Thermoprotei archaeon]|nr:coenzyme F420 hydrogenase [Thermoprotei archaeon]
MLSRKTYPLVRIGGEAKLVVEHDGEKPIRAYLVTRAPVRGFEKMLEGKNPLFAIEAAMRICGICHAAHGVAACEAIEHALGILPPRDGLLLREAIGLINRVQSHILQEIMILPDMLVDNVRDKIFRELVTVFNDVCLLLLKVGGAPTHPPYLTIGGILKKPAEASFNEAKSLAKKIYKSYCSVEDKLLDEDLWRKEFLELKNISFPTRKLASHLFYGNRYNIKVDEIAVVKRQENTVYGESTSNIALYSNEVVEVGPRARLETYLFKRMESLAGLQEARIVETELVLRRVTELLEEIDLSAPLRSHELIFTRGTGVGVYEAPRGTLVHKVKLDAEGRVEYYEIVTPTMFNIPLMEKAVTLVPLTLAEVVPRIYDPCIPCSTHLVEVRR